MTIEPAVYGYVVWENVADWGEPDDVTVSWYPTLGDATQAAGNACRVSPLLLHGQSFGFTREDVVMVRRLFKQQMDIAKLPGPYEAETVSRATQIDNLADRIEALLPPEE